jgi:hypothetical protein
LGCARVNNNEEQNKNKSKDIFSHFYTSIKPNIDLLKGETNYSRFQ